MSKTLLNGVNEVLKRVQIVSESNLLTSLTNSGKQVFIDLAVQAWREATQQVFSKANVMMPNQGKEGSVTLVAGTRAYTLASDLVQIRWPLHDETNGQYIVEYPGGYEELRNSQNFPANYTGLPLQGAISPIDAKLYLDYIPTSSEAGYVYKYFYWKATDLVTYDDVFPFDDDVFWALVPVVSDIWRMMQQNKTSDGYTKLSYGRAIRMLKKHPPSDTWISRRAVPNTSPLGFDPFDDRKY